MEFEKNTEFHILRANINRRRFLSLALLMSLEIAGCNRPKDPFLNQNLIEHEKDGVRLLIHGNGMPIKYILPCHKEVFLDQLAAKETRQKALDKQEPEVLTYISFPDLTPENPGYFKSSPEHPLVRELPKDTLTEEELAERGVKIIQGEETSLFLRKSAFNNGELLENNVIGSKRKLIIALIDGPCLSTLFTGNQKYDEIRPVFKQFPVSTEDTEVLRAKDLQLYFDIIQKERKKLQKAREKSDVDEIESGRHLLFRYKVRLAARQDHINDYQLLIARAPLGGYFGSGSLPQMPETSVITISVGRVSRRKQFVIYFDEEGKVQLSVLEGWDLLPERYNVPHPSDTHPRLPGFYRADGSNYLFTPDKVGFQLRHELAHHKVYSDPDYNSKDEHAEAEADTIAAESMGRAWDRWFQSGFTDDRDEYIIFKNNFDEGYIFT